MIKEESEEKKDLPEVLTEAEAAKYLRVHANTLRTWAKDGKIKRVKLVGTQNSPVRYRLSTLREFVASWEDSPADPLIIDRDVQAARKAIDAAKSKASQNTP